MDIKVGDQFTCEMLPGEKLEVIKKYNNRMFTLKRENSRASYLCSNDLHRGFRLTLAHVSEHETKLTKVERSFQW